MMVKIYQMGIRMKSHLSKTSCFPLKKHQCENLKKDEVGFNLSRRLCGGKGIDKNVGVKGRGETDAKMLRKIQEE